MGKLVWGLVFCLGFGVAGAVVVWLLGSVLLVFGGILFGSDPIGHGLLQVFVLIPGGFGLGVLAAGVLLWKGRTRTDTDTGAP